MQPRLLNATADANGNVAESYFDQVPQFREWTGPVSVPNANPTAKWQVLRDEVVIGVMFGATPFGPVYARAGERVGLIGSGVTPNAKVLGVWNVVDTPDGSGPDLAPDVLPLSLTATRPAQLLD